MFDLLFISQTYTPLYIISDSEMKELERTQNHEEIEVIINQKKRLEEAYKAQIKHLQQREKKELRNEL